MSVIGAYMVPHPPMIIPQVGRGSQAQIDETIQSYERVAGEIAALAPETILITTPHSVMYADYFHISPGKRARGSFARFRAPMVKFEEAYDQELAGRICDAAAKIGFPAGEVGERDANLDHGAMVPLWFIRKRYSGGKIVRISLSGLPLPDHYRLGMIIRDAVICLINCRNPAPTDSFWKARNMTEGLWMCAEEARSGSCLNLMRLSVKKRRSVDTDLSLSWQEPWMA